jgi:hypothetical protein
VLLWFVTCGLKRPFVRAHPIGPLTCPVVLLRIFCFSPGLERSVLAAVGLTPPHTGSAFSAKQPHRFPGRPFLGAASLTAGAGGQKAHARDYPKAAVSLTGLDGRKQSAVRREKRRGKRWLKTNHCFWERSKAPTTSLLPLHVTYC